MTFPSKSASLGVCSVVSSQLSAFASRDPIVPPTIRVPPASCLFELRTEVKINLLTLSSVQLEHTSSHMGMDENQVHTSLEHLQNPSLTQLFHCLTPTAGALALKTVNCFSVWWRRGPQRNWRSQGKAASMTLFGSCICLALPHFWFVKFFLFFSISSVF